MEQNNKTFAEIIAQMKEKAKNQEAIQPKSKEEVIEILKKRFKELKESKEKNGNNL